jgi:hypothetical protein
MTADIKNRQNRQLKYLIQQRCSAKQKIKKLTLIFEHYIEEKVKKKLFTAGSLT